MKNKFRKARETYSVPRVTERPKHVNAVGAPAHLSCNEALGYAAHATKSLRNARKAAQR